MRENRAYSSRFCARHLTAICAIAPLDPRLYRESDSIRDLRWGKRLCETERCIIHHTSRPREDPFIGLRHICFLIEVRLAPIESKIGVSRHVPSSVQRHAMRHQKLALLSLKRYLSDLPIAI
jgi:hypothetical protein